MVDVERGDIILIGATTENPSFEVISALLSRSRVYALRGLTVPELLTLLRRALPLLHLDAGEDRMYIARRLVRMAIEDISLADPRALEQAVAGMQAVHFLGIPEGDLALAQAAIYLAVAPKSDAAMRAVAAVKEDVEKTIAEPVPMNLQAAIYLCVAPKSDAAMRAM